MPKVDLACDPRFWGSKPSEWCCLGRGESLGVWESLSEWPFFLVRVVVVGMQLVAVFVGVV